jgi:hypothetical protein
MKVLSIGQGPEWNRLGEPEGNGIKATKFL